MERKIVDFYLDENNDWVARLDCHHGQHVRHNPPFVVREWTQSERGRQARIATTLQCLKCDRLEWPDHLQPFERTSEFNQNTMPAILTRDHAMDTGVWACIHVLEGELVLIVAEPHNQETVLKPGTAGTIAPGMMHRIKVGTNVRFYIEYFRWCGEQSQR